jgi:hypothetical protein
MHGFGIRMDRYQIIDTCWLDRRERFQLDLLKTRLGLLLILIESATLPHQSASISEPVTPEHISADPYLWKRELFMRIGDVCLVLPMMKIGQKITIERGNNEGQHT